MDKVIHIALHFNDEVTKGDIGTNLKLVAFSWALHKFPGKKFVPVV